MSRISEYTALTSAQANAIVPVVDPSDTTMAPSGTTKRITVGNLLTSAQTYFQPADIGVLVASQDPAVYDAAQILTAGTVYLAKLPIRTAVTVSKTTWIVTTAGTGASTGTFTALFSSTGALLSGSADVAASLTPAGLVQLSLTTPQALTAGSFVWSALLVNLASTQPTLSAAAAVDTAVLNAGLSAATFRAAVNGTGRTTLPASITPASNTATGAFGFWAGLA